MSARSFAIETHRREAAPWVGMLGRIGMAASGVLYIVVGTLAVGVALDKGGKTTDSQGAFQTLADHAWGKALLVLLAIGFAGYALWRFAVAAFGAKLETNEELNALKRLWYVVRGTFFGFLCWTTLQVLFGADEKGGSRTEERGSGELLSWPAGRWLVGAVGLGVLAYAVGCAYRGVTRKFEDDLATGEMDGRARRWICRLGTTGYLAKAVVFAIIGILLLRAARDYDPQKSKGLDGALAELARQPYGDALLGATAAGLIAWGLFRFAQARYREV